MRNQIALLLLGGLLTCAATLQAQPPGGRPRGGGAVADPAAMAARLMAFDANGDGKLTKEEVADERLLPLLTRANANGDESTSREELVAQLQEEVAAAAATGSQRGGPGGGVPDGPRGGGPRRGGPPQPGQIISPFVQEALQLTDNQKEKLAALQKDVDSQLAKILTDEQKQQLAEMRNRGPGGPGDPGGGPGGRGPNGPVGLPDRPPAERE